ncbi:unnamed protein product [Rhizophagus irregularis]|nr:unnamed protein product [Rhizophagus irregularis]
MKVIHILHFLLLKIHNVNLSKMTERNANQCSTIISKSSRTKNVLIFTIVMVVLCKNFKDDLQIMIKEAIEKDDVVPSQSYL